MDLTEKFQTLSKRALSIYDKLGTEEATKTALVLPFIALLGFDIHNPVEVIPEFTADVGTKKGEKVDYAIAIDNKIVLLIECKKCGENLDHYTSQLFRYFTVLEARIAILTDGLVYKFYSDLDERNKLDKTPFHVIDLKDLKDSIITDISKITRNSFDVEHILTTAQDLKYIREIKSILQAEFLNPSWMVQKIVAKSSYGGNKTSRVIEWFTELTKRSLKSIEDSNIRKRLRMADKLSEDPEALNNITQNESVEMSKDPSPNGTAIETTMEEHEGFHYIKSMLVDMMDVSRVHMRDTGSYCGILCDDNNRKPICRLHFNNLHNKAISIGKSYTKINIRSVQDVLKHRREIVEAAASYIDVEAVQPEKAE